MRPIGQSSTALNKVEVLKKTHQNHYNENIYRKATLRQGKVTETEMPCQNR